MEWLLLINVGTLLWYSYFACMVVMWFQFGMSDGKDGKDSIKELDTGEQFWLCIILTALAPVVLTIAFFGFFYKKGKVWGAKKVELEKLKHEQEFGNEEGYDENALRRLGVGDD